MTAYKDLSKEELLELKNGLEAQFTEVKARGLKLDMSRGKPSAEQLNLSMGMMDVAKLMMSNAAEGGLYDVEEFEHVDGWGYQHTTVMENFACHILEGTPLLAPGSEGINGVNLANAAQLSSWLNQEVANPVDPELYAKELNKRIAAEGKFPVRE